ncbi:MAG: cupin domain-containing protein [Caldilineales bacterium]|nr:cupin domain-containing protein [Caldilineales bacterium]
MESKIASVGLIAKEMRLQRGLTLEEVAERSGCTPGFLSQVERNKAVPSISLLYSLAKALDTQVTQFFPEPIKAAKIVRHQSRDSFHFEGSPTHYSLLTSKFPHSGIDGFLLNVIPAHKALPTDEHRAHEGEEFYYVLKGVVRFWLEEESYDLYQGDSIHFRSNVPHRLENLSDDLSEIFSIINPAIF